MRNSELFSSLGWADLKALAKVWYLIILKLSAYLVALTWPTGEILAYNYDYYKGEFEKMKSFQTETTRQLNQAKEALSKHTKERALLLEKAHSQLESSAAAKGREMQVQLSDFRETSRAVNNFTRVYLVRMSELEKRYHEIVADFKSYRASESQRQSTLIELSEKVRGARTVEELIEPKVELEKILLNEANRFSFIKVDASQLSNLFARSYQKYRKQVSVHDDFIRENEFPVAPVPLGAIHNLDRMVTYADERYLVMQADLKASLNEIIVKTEEIIKTKVTEWKDSHEEQKRYYRESSEFLDRINEDISALNESLKYTSSVTTIAGEPLRKQFDAYHTILSYKSTCHDLTQMKKDGSPFFTGCAVLQGAIANAEEFMKSTAWLKIGTTLFNLGDEAEVSTNLKRLREMKIRRRAPGTSLVDAIRLHDSILQRVTQIRAAQDGGE